MIENIVDIASVRAEKGIEAQAAEYKERATTLLNSIMELMRDAESKCWRIEFSIQRDQLGKVFYTGPTISRQF